MAQKQISDLTLRSDFDGTCSVPVDDASQSWRVTGAQILAYANTNKSNPAYSSKSANYTLLAADSTIFADASGAGFTLSLPAAASNTGKVYVIKRTDDTPANALTIDPNSTELIDGLSTLVLYAKNEMVMIQCTGTAWVILARLGNKYSARYSKITGSYTAGSTSIIDFPVKTWDEANCVTTGAGFRYTAKQAGKYRIISRTGTDSRAWTATHRSHHYYYKNGVEYSIGGTERVWASATTQGNVLASDEVILAVGDYVDVRMDASINFDYSTDPSVNHVTIELVQ